MSQMSKELSASVHHEWTIYLLECVTGAFYLQGQGFIITGKGIFKHHSGQQLPRQRVISHVILKLLLSLKSMHLWKRTTKIQIPLLAVLNSSHVHLFSTPSHIPTLVLTVLTKSREVG